MKVLYSLLMLVGLSFIVDCQNNQANVMVPLDERLKR